MCGDKFVSQCSQIYIGLFECTDTHLSKLCTALWGPLGATSIHEKVGVKRSGCVTHLHENFQAHQIMVLGCIIFFNQNPMTKSHWDQCENIDWDHCKNMA